MKVMEIAGSFGIDSLRVAERPKPTPGPGQVLLRMSAASLNYRDLLVALGMYNPKMPLPRIPLSDGVGRVEELGSGVTRVKVGERVAGLFFSGWVEGDITKAKADTALGGAVDGVLAEYVVLPAEGVTTVPEHLTDLEAATLPCAALTAWNALVTHGHVKSGDTVLLQGTGGVSLFALQFAKLHGATVIITSSSDEKLDRAKALGADSLINYKQHPDWAARVLQLTDGVGVDHVIEVGGAGTLDQSLKAVRMSGYVAMIGVLTAGQGEFNPMAILMKSANLQGIYVGSRVMFEAMNRAITSGAVKPVVDRVFAFNEAAQALKHMQSASHFGKIAIAF